MSRRGHLFGRCLLALAMSAAASSALADGPTTKPISAAISLANVPSSDGGVDWGRAEGTIDARLEDVLAVLHDYARYAALFPHFEQSRVLSQRGTDAIVYLEAKILHGATTLWGQVRIGSRSPAPGSYVIEAKMMKGKGNISQLVARWQVQPSADGQSCRVVFDLLVDPDLPVPDVLVSSELKNSAGRAFRALRKRVAQHGTIAARPTTSM